MNNKPDLFLQYRQAELEQAKQEFYSKQKKYIKPQKTRRDYKLGTIQKYSNAWYERIDKNRLSSE